MTLAVIKMDCQGKNLRRTHTRMQLQHASPGTPAGLYHAKNFRERPPVCPLSKPRHTVQDRRENESPPESRQYGFESVSHDTVWID
jgi:hypothetical protein